MADTPLVSVADAIAEEIAAAVAAGDFDWTFETSVIWGKRQRELSGETGIRVDVVPLNWTLGLDADGCWKYLVRCQVGVRRKFTTVDAEQAGGKISDTEIKSLVNLLSALIEMFVPKSPSNTGRVLSSVQNAAWTTEDRVDRDLATHAMVDWDMLDKRQFLGWFELAYEVDA